MEPISSVLREVKSQEAQANSETAGVKDSTSPSNKICSVCEGTEYERMPDGRYRQCVPCQEKKNLQYANSIIPARFKDSTFENWIPRNRKQQLALEKIRQLDFDSSGEFMGIGDFCLIGPYGCGKTHLLYCMYRRVATGVGRKAQFRTTKQLIDELVADELDKKPSDIRSALGGRDEEFHLFWDDADKIKVTDYKLEVLFDVIDTIYRNQCGLSLTTNLDLVSLQEKLSPAICRRIDDICTKVEL